MGKPLDSKQIKILQEMFEESGALAFGKQSILEYSQKAKDILAQTQLNDEAKKSILILIKKMEKLEH
jgi:geranylgeranyl pyrophosphate synthase